MDFSPLLERIEDVVALLVVLLHRDRPRKVCVEVSPDRRGGAVKLHAAASITELHPREGIGVVAVQEATPSTEQVPVRAHQQLFQLFPFRRVRVGVNPFQGLPRIQPLQVLPADHSKAVQVQAVHDGLSDSRIAEVWPPEASQRLPEGCRLHRLLPEPCPRKLSGCRGGFRSVPNRRAASEALLRPQVELRQHQRFLWGELLQPNNAVAVTVHHLPHVLNIETEAMTSAVSTHVRLSELATGGMHRPPHGADLVTVGPLHVRDQFRLGLLRACGAVLRSLMFEMACHRRHLLEISLHPRPGSSPMGHMETTPVLRFQLHVLNVLLRTLLPPLQQSAKLDLVKQLRADVRVELEEEKLRLHDGAFPIDIDAFEDEVEVFVGGPETETSALLRENVDCHIVFRGRGSCQMPPKLGRVAQRRLDPSPESCHQPALVGR
mmetsp:Transcript_17618/g.50127  ORF Transcript_17618/g.50127 Transcript_17618/m.50127 type:complete len:435 (-) Transcript_17618:766-2070(-)